MIVKIGNKEVQLTDYLSANQIKKALYETYEQGYADAENEHKAMCETCIHKVSKEDIEQIRADVCNTLTELCDRWIDDDGNCWNTDCPFNDDVCKVMQLKEQK